MKLVPYLRKKLILLLLSVSLMPAVSQAQLSGNYTIGSSATADYPDFTSAVNALESSGIGGPVWFDIEPGTYNEQLILNGRNISGFSAQDSIVFDGGNPANITLISNMRTVFLEDIDHVSIMNMTIETTSDEPHEEVIRIGRNPDTTASYINVLDNVLIKDAGTDNDLNANSVRSFGDHHYIINNHFQGSPGYNYLAWGGDEIHFHNNLMDPASRYGGVIILNMESFYAHNNVIANITGTFSLSSGFEIRQSNKRIEIIGNIMYGMNRSGITGVLDPDITADPGNPSVIANNIITSSFHSSLGDGIDLDIGDLENMIIAYNSVYSENHALSLGGNKAGIEMYNNSFYGDGGSAEIDDAIGIVASDFNNFYGDIDFDGTTYTDLSSYQTFSGLDANSHEGDPEYAHVTNDLTPIGTQLYQNATPLPGLGFDAFDRPRDAVSPTIGAIEIMDYDIEIVDIVSPGVQPECGQENHDIYGVIKNLGGSPMSGFDLIVEMTGDISGADTLSYPGTLGGFSENDTILVGQLNTLDAGNITLTLYHNDSDDQFQGNDTLTVQREILEVPEEPVAVHDTTCGAPGSVLISASSPESEIEWYSVSQGGFVLHQGDTFQTPSLNQTTIFYAEAIHDQTGCSAPRKPVSVVALDLPEAEFAQKDTLSGVWSDGTESDPDLVCAASIHEYDILPPAGMENDDYGNSWTISNAFMQDEQNTSAVNFQVHPPAGGDNAYIEFHPEPHETGTLFRIALEVTDIENGCVDTTERFLTVMDIPQAELETDTSICPGESFTLYNYTTIGDTQSVQYEIDFGDGNVQVMEEADSLVHAYNTTGTYTISLKAVTSTGCMDVTTKQVVVRNAAEAGFELVDTQCILDSVQMTNLSDAGGDEMNFFWDFGDGEGSHDEHPDHAYQDDGDFEIILVAESEYGCADTVSQNITVNPAPVAFFETENVCKGTVSHFDNASEVPENDFTWSFGDGDSSFVAEPEHTYDSEGVYTVSLTETNEYGCSTTHSEEVEVYGLPESGFTTEEGEDGHLVFIPDATDLPYYEWDFGDGTQSNLESPSHRYDEIDTFEVTLSVMDENDCTSSTTRNIMFDLIASIGDAETANFEWQIYPNPADENVNIEFNLKEVSLVEVRLYTYTGQKVNLQESDQYAPGVHSVSLNAHDLKLSGGLYFVELTVNGQTNFKPVTITE